MINNNIYLKQLGSVSEAINSLYYLIGFIFCHNLADWQTKNFIMDLFGQIKGHIGILPIGFLQMRRNWVVNQCLYPMLIKISFQPVTFVVSDHKEMPDIIVINKVCCRLKTIR